MHVMKYCIEMVCSYIEMEKCHWCNTKYWLMWLVICEDIYWGMSRIQVSLLFLLLCTIAMYRYLRQILRSWLKGILRSVFHFYYPLPVIVLCIGWLTVTSLVFLIFHQSWSSVTEKYIWLAMMKIYVFFFPVF